MPERSRIEGQTAAAGLSTMDLGVHGQSRRRLWSPGVAVCEYDCLNGPVGGCVRINLGGMLSQGWWEMRFDVLGPIRVTVSAEVTPSPGKTASLAGKIRLGLLALLLARANTPVPAEYLLDALWGGRSDASSMQRL